jgi:hypothetical protein
MVRGAGILIFVKRLTYPSRTRGLRLRFFRAQVRHSSTREADNPFLLAQLKPLYPPPSIVLALPIDAVETREPCESLDHPRAGRD